MQKWSYKGRTGRENAIHASLSPAFAGVAEQEARHD